MRKVIMIVLLGGVLFSLVGFHVNAQVIETSLELKVYQVVISEDVASITEHAVNSTVELYDNLGEELLASGLTDSKGAVTFFLNEKYPLSTTGLYHTAVVVDGMKNGIVTCQQGTTCKAVVFTPEGLDPEQDAALLIIKVVRSDDLTEPVEGGQMTVWPADGQGGVLAVADEIISNKWVKYAGVPCTSNIEGYCAAYLRDHFRWEQNPGLDYPDPKYRLTGETEKRIGTNFVVKYGREISNDASGNWIPQGNLLIVQLAADDKGKLDDCTFKPVPAEKLLNPSCMDKVHQTATVQAQVTVDPADRDTLNNAIVQASLLSKEVVERFIAHEPDQAKIDGFLTTADSAIEDPSTDMKLILDVKQISIENMTAFVDGPAHDKVVEITSPDNPDILLGACRVNSLGECISAIKRSDLMAPDGLLKLHILADGYDNGIMICKDEPVCMQEVFTVRKFNGVEDAILVYKFVKDGDYSQPVAGIEVLTGLTEGWTEKKGYYYVGEGCISNEKGICIIYGTDNQVVPGEGDLVAPQMSISGDGVLDAVYPRPHDNQLAIHYIAINSSRAPVDCTFSSPLTYELRSYNPPNCFARKKALQTAAAGYTATPTVTVTPMPSLTPTTVPPTQTLTPSPTSQPGLLEEESVPLAIGIGSLVLLGLIGGGVWLILRRRKDLH